VTGSKFLPVFFKETCLFWFFFLLPTLKIPVNLVSGHFLLYKVVMMGQKPKISLDETVGVTIFQIITVCIFGYGIIEKGMSSWHWLTYIGISFVFLVFLAGAKRNK